MLGGSDGLQVVVEEGQYVLGEMLAIISRCVNLFVLFHGLFIHVYDLSRPPHIGYLVAEVVSRHGRTLHDGRPFNVKKHDNNNNNNNNNATTTLLHRP